MKMGLLNRGKKKSSNNEWVNAKNQNCVNGIASQDWVDRYAMLPVYYSTPAGEDRDGKPRLWVLNGNNSNVSFYPAFSSEEKIREFFLKNGREAFMIIDGNIESLLSSFDAVTLMNNFGAIIDPGTDGQIIIEPKIRVSSK